MVNVILCGGSGTRLWPVSRRHFPKQFCDLVGVQHRLFAELSAEILEDGLFVHKKALC